MLVEPVLRNHLPYVTLVQCSHGGSRKTRVTEFKNKMRNLSYFTELPFQCIYIEGFMNVFTYNSVTVY